MKHLVLLLASAVFLCAVAAAQNNSSLPSTEARKSISRQVITNGPVAETISDSSALIGWSSREPVTATTLQYGTNRDHMTQSADAVQNSDNKNHHVRLESLTPDTTYYFQVMQNGEAQSGIGTFHTVATGEKTVQSKAVISPK